MHSVQEFKPEVLFSAITEIEEKHKPEQITLIDDVITKGSTIFACAVKLQEVFPNTKIRAFALFITRGFEQQIAAVINLV